MLSADACFRRGLVLIFEGRAGGYRRTSCVALSISLFHLSIFRGGRAPPFLFCAFGVAEVWRDAVYMRCFLWIFVACCVDVEHHLFVGALLLCLRVFRACLVFVGVDGPFVSVVYC